VAHAQALEHYAPVVPSRFAARPGLRVLLPVAPADEAALGPRLKAIVVSNDPALVGGAGYFSSAEAMSPGEVRLTQVLALSGLPFLDRPISRSLIGEIEAGLTAQYAARNLAVIVRVDPDQDLSTGIVHVRLIPIVVNTLSVNGAVAKSSTDIQSRLGVRQGQAVDRTRFAYDLAALNRYPFRQIEAVFAPETAGGTADLNLVVTQTRPWEVYGGFKYSGSRDLTMRRYFVGGSVGNVLGRDSVLSFQIVASPDMALHQARHPKFKDITASYSLPVTRHTQLEANLELSELNFRIAPATYRFVDLMAALGVRQDIADFARAGVASDIRFGIEAKNEQETVFAGAVQTLQISSESLQAYAGYHTTHEAGAVRSEFDIVVHVSPGGLDPGNTSAQAQLYSEGRVKSARYAYLNFSYDHVRPLTRRLIWHSLVTGQLASAALPFSEQGGIGSAALVRGYFFIDGTFDSTLIVRNEITLNRKKEGATRPYVFFDAGAGAGAGAGQDVALGKTDVVASFGVGASVRLPAKSSLRIEGVHTLRNGQFTRAGTDSIMANLTFKY
jgi:hemolysin activation/secretion protein